MWSIDYASQADGSLVTKVGHMLCPGVSCSAYRQTRRWSGFSSGDAATCSEPEFVSELQVIGTMTSIVASVPVTLTETEVKRHLHYDSIMMIAKPRPLVLPIKY